MSGGSSSSTASLMARIARKSTDRSPQTAATVKCSPCRPPGHRTGDPVVAFPHEGGPRDRRSTTVRDEDSALHPARGEVWPGRAPFRRRHGAGQRCCGNKVLSPHPGVQTAGESRRHDQPRPIGVDQRMGGLGGAIVSAGPRLGEHDSAVTAPSLPDGETVALGHADLGERIDETSALRSPGRRRYRGRFAEQQIEDDMRDARSFTSSATSPSSPCRRNDD